MTAPHLRRTKLTACAAAAAALLVACGDDPDDAPAPAPTPATTLQGVAALGAPFSGATVTVVDSDAATTDPAPVTADAEGRYSIDVSALKAPLVLKASGNFQGGPTELVSVLRRLKRRQPVWMAEPGHAPAPSVQDPAIDRALENSPASPEPEP